MKVLFLGNSSEVYGNLPEGERRTSRAAAALEEAFGEPVEMRIRTIWPNAALPGRIEKWVADDEPDIVYLNVISFWFNYQSVPLMFERKFGRAGAPLKEAGIKASQIPWLGHTRAFHWSRELLQRLLGGATYFEPEQVIDVVTECVRLLVRREDTVVVVKGPRSSAAYNLERSKPWAEERRQKVHRALARLCTELHVDYVGVEQPRYLTQPEKDLLGDRLHTGAQGHAQSGAEIADVLKTAWDRQRADLAAR